MSSRLTSLAGKMFFKLPAISLQSKVVLLAVGTALFAVVTTGAIFYDQISRIAYDLAVQRLRGETKLAATRLEDAYKFMEQDALFLSHTPPIEGIMRSVASGDGIDHADGSTLGQWRNRLATIFASKLLNTSYYTQIRLIGLAHGGRELVRVNQGPQGPEIVGEASLQSKIQEPYMQDNLTMRPGDVYYSDVTLNREHGRVSTDMTPTIRFVWPIFDDHGKLFGMLVINADYQKLLAQLLRRIDPHEETIVTNQSGDYIVYNKDGSLSRLYLANESSAVPPLVHEILGSDLREDIWKDDKRVGYMVRIPIRSSGPKELFLGLATTLPKDLFLHQVYAARAKAAVYILIFSALLALVAARLISRPLRHLQTVLSNMPKEKLRQHLPVHLDNEVGGLARAFVSMADDLNAATMAEERVERLYQDIIEATPDGLISIDHRGRIILFNPACERIFGYEAREVLGENVKMLMPDHYADQHDGYLEHYLNTGEKRIIGLPREVEGQRKNGEVFPMYLRIREIGNGGGSQFTAIIQDITARKRLETDLSTSNAELERFAYVASHDLKAPLRGIDNLAKWIREDVAQNMSEETSHNLDLLQNRVQRMEHLLDDLLEYSRVGRTPVDAEPVFLSKILNDVEDMVVAATNFTLEVDHEMEGISLPRMPVQQVFHNLINNAIKHHHRQEGRIEITVIKGGRDYTFSVKDDGPGIDPEYHDKIFDMFCTLRPRDEVEGSGMGLALVKKIVMSQGGKIWVDSAPGQGTAFTFTWPIPTGVAATADAPEIEADMPTKKVA